MMEILFAIRNVMDNIVVFGLGLVGAYFIVTGLMELKSEKPPKKKITVSNHDKNNAA